MDYLPFVPINEGIDVEEQELLQVQAKHPIPAEVSVIFIGPRNAGKSSIVAQYFDQQFEERTTAADNSRHATVRSYER